MPFLGFEVRSQLRTVAFQSFMCDRPTDEPLWVEVEGGEVEALVRSELLGVFGDLGGRGGAETRRFPSLLNPFS